MPKLTYIYRVSQPLYLCASMDSDDERLAEYKDLSKQILKKLAPNSPPNACITANAYYFIYIMENDVCYLTLCESSYPKKLAYLFLEELQKEFDLQHGAEVPAAKRPYQFISFDTFIQKTKKLYEDTQSQRNLNKVTEDLHEIHSLMTKHITDVLGRGEKLDNITAKSEELLFESKQYAKMAKWLNRMGWWRKYAPCIIVGIVLLLVMYLRFWWFV